MNENLMGDLRNPIGPLHTIGQTGIPVPYEVARSNHSRFKGKGIHHLYAKEVRTEAIVGFRELRFALDSIVSQGHFGC